MEKTEVGGEIHGDKLARILESPIHLRIGSHTFHVLAFRLNREAAATVIHQHLHPHVELGISLDGGHRFRILKRNLDLGKGRAIAIPAGLSHTRENVKGTLLLGFQVHLATLGADADEPLRNDPVVIDLDRETVSLFRSFLKDLNDPRPGWEALCHSRLVGALVCLVRQLPGVEGSAETRLQGRGLLDRVIPYIDSHLTEALSHQHLAVAMGVSSRHINRLFQSEFGTTVSRYVLDKRLAQAYTQLSQGVRSVREVSRLTGIEDPAYLSRLIRKKFGMSPSELKSGNR